MMKLATHVVVFVLGGAAGIYWGVNHPQNAQQIHDTEQAQLDRGKAVISAAKDQINQHPAPGVATPPLTSGN